MLLPKDQSVGTEDLIAAVAPDDHLLLKMANAAGIQFTHARIGHGILQFLTIKDDARLQYIEFGMPVHVLIITLPGYAEVITEAVHTTAFALEGTAPGQGVDYLASEFFRTGI